MRPDLDEGRIRRYLLGLLPDEEAEGLEQAYLARADVLAQVRAVEDDLLDDYAAGRLGADETESFESRYLTSPSRKQRVVVARALRRAAGAALRPPTTPFPAARRPPWLGPLAMAAGLLFAVAALWRLQSPAMDVPTAPEPPASVGAGQTPAPVPPATAAPDDVPDPSPPRAPVTTARLVFALSPVLLRGDQRPQELRIPPGAGTVVLELDGDPVMMPPLGSRLDVVVQTVEGARVWSGGATRVGDPARTSRLASVSVPVTRLPPGDYLVTLSTGEEPLYRYFVRLPSVP